MQKNIGQSHPIHHPRNNKKEKKKREQNPQEKHGNYGRNPAEMKQLQDAQEP